ncbi:tetratricopeptide repeat protein [Phenylobacterium sp.]|uniref:tetratricopeptide repeat-containing glycosyltransferase family protein n=1 Tax=Phenylobacterium sp. TaxID=1871053 RepID=UPI00273382D2|nr:tetratricopeptide repeat protein [Phenylobacterium sp.]MDP3855306.1 tetratricopeptide repeat protein [Phenylobacterium sp.]
MLRPSAPSATSPGALGVGAAPTPARLSAGAVGDSGSSDVLAKLSKAVEELKALKVQPLLHQAVAALNAGDAKAGAEWAIKALEQDERNGFGWYLLAIAREKASDFVGSITCYESALALLPDHAEIANNLGRLAYRLGQKPVAEKLFRHYLARFPEDHEGANNLACVLRDQQQYGDAIELLKSAIGRAPAQPLLWNTLGSTLAEQGDPANAEIFFDEALRLDPGFAKARYNRGNVRLFRGDTRAALEDCEKAMTSPKPADEQLMMQLARSTILLNLGRVGEGWDDYEARLDPKFSDVTVVMVDRPRWSPGADLAGKSMLIVGEQGLGDEIMFANVLPDVIEALGPNGRLILAVEPRLVPLFQRSYPAARVGAHATYLAEGRTYRPLPFLDDAAMAGIDLWTPIGSLLREFRREVSAYPVRPHFLEADPVRVAHWRKVLDGAPAGRKVGLLWKSGSTLGARHRYYSTFEQWAGVLAAPGIAFVNLQYGDVAGELEQARRELGVEIWNPPGIDLKQDLDDVAALSCALDLVIGFPNATSNIAAACGAPSWLISAPASWPRLGTDRLPWYPQMRVFIPERFGEWDPVMDEVAQAMAAFGRT